MAVMVRVAEVMVTKVVTTTLAAPMPATSTNRDLSDLLDVADSVAVHAVAAGSVVHGPRDHASKQHRTANVLYSPARLYEILTVLKKKPLIFCILGTKNI